MATFRNCVAVIRLKYHHRIESTIRQLSALALHTLVHKDGDYTWTAYNVFGVLVNWSMCVQLGWLPRRRRCRRHQSKWPQRQCVVESCNRWFSVGHNISQWQTPECWLRCTHPLRDTRIEACNWFSFHVASLDPVDIFRARDVHFLTHRLSTYCQMKHKQYFQKASIPKFDFIRRKRKRMHSKTCRWARLVGKQRHAETIALRHFSETQHNKIE